MKIYKAYLSLTDKEYSKCTGVMDRTMGFWSSEKERWYVLYGFTNKKKLFNEFMSYHSDRFIIKIDDITEKEYSEIWKNKKCARIEMYSIEYAYEKEVKITMSFMEHNFAIDYKEENAFEYNMISGDVDFKIFKPMYQKILLEVGYVGNYINTYSYDNDIREMWDYNYSYMYDNYRINELVMYILTYKDFLKISKIQEYVIKKVSKK